MILKALLNILLFLVGTTAPAFAAGDYAQVATGVFQWILCIFGLVLLAIIGKASLKKNGAPFARKKPENSDPDPSKQLQDFPWPSALALLYPIIATIYLASTPAPLVACIGYGLANLGYVLFAAGVISGKFRIFRLGKRWQVFVFALGCFILGTVLSNSR